MKIADEYAKAEAAFKKAEAAFKEAKLAIIASGKTRLVGDKAIVEVHSHDRENVSWKGIAEKMIPASRLERLKMEFSSTSEVVQLKVLAKL